MAEFLFALPGTPADSPDWSKPPQPVPNRADWMFDGLYPEVAVKRDGILISPRMPIDAAMDMVTAAQDA